MSNSFYPQLVIFYDGQCPLWVREMTQLKLKDDAQKIQFEDILEPDFSERFPKVSMDDANHILHGLENGEMVYGLDVMHRQDASVASFSAPATLHNGVSRYILPSNHKGATQGEKPALRLILPVLHLQSKDQHVQCLTGEH